LVGRRAGGDVSGRLDPEEGKEAWLECRSSRKSFPPDEKLFHVDRSHTISLLRFFSPFWPSSPFWRFVGAMAADQQSRAIHPARLDSTERTKGFSTVTGNENYT
jgi:hypothetical protein